MSKETIVVVGGVAAGASAAATARRCSEEAKIIIYEKGPYISYEEILSRFFYKIDSLILIYFDY